MCFFILMVNNDDVRIFKTDSMKSEILLLVLLFFFLLLIFAPVVGSCRTGLTDYVGLNCKKKKKNCTVQKQTEKEGRN